MTSGKRKQKKDGYNDTNGNKIRVVWSRISLPEGSNGPAPPPHHTPPPPEPAGPAWYMPESRPKPSTPKEKAIKKVSNQILYSNIFGPEDSHFYGTYHTAL